VNDLQRLAERINDLAGRMEDVRLEFCRALAEAFELVKKESNLSWAQWASENLRKPDGSKWSAWTLYKYVNYGRHPQRLDYSRADIARRGRIDRAIRHDVTHSAPVAEKAVAAQYWALMQAWNNASAAAKRMFLDEIERQQPRKIR
jgi:hypothetical protein